MRESTKRLVRLGVLAAISLLLIYLIRIPLFPSAAFLEYDMADVPILIATFLFGPWWGLALTAVVSVLQWLLVSQASGFIGALMHFFATGAYVLIAGYIYGRFHTRKGAIIALLSGAVAMILMMIPLNLIFTVHFMGAPKEVVVGMLGPIIIPFNAIKAGINGLLTFVLYKATAYVLRLERKAPLTTETRGDGDRL